ncbi:MAG: glycerol-3-phosphate cytidylyltransferase [Aquifex sp.]|nr:MAG: glycerol-3-phosphate cytidylyltransferase [Aquifex sp.]
MLEKKGKVVITYGTFDLFHIGHLNLLKRAKSLGDYLIVGVSTDEFNEIKGKKSVFPYEHRAEIVRSIKYVDLVIPEKSWEQKIEDIKKYKVDVFVMGDDWKGKFDYLKEYCEVIYLPRTQGISTTELKETLLRLSTILEEDIIKVLDIVVKGKNYLKQIK